MKFLELSLNHKELLRFSVPKLGAALPMDSTEQEQQRLAGWGRGAADGTGLGCRAASLLSHPLQLSVTPAAGKLAAGAAQVQAVNPGLRALWECGNRGGR